MLGHLPRGITAGGPLTLSIPKVKPEKHASPSVLLSVQLLSNLPHAVLQTLQRSATCADSFNYAILHYFISRPPSPHPAPHLERVFVSNDFTQER